LEESPFSVGASVIGAGIREVSGEIVSADAQLVTDPESC
jgi:hypothetical protein